jgi:hypothetical protein
MRRKESETIKFYGNDGLPIVNGTPVSTLTRYHYVNKPRFKHKKKPISMIKALNVRDRINNKKHRWLY